MGFEPTTLSLANGWCPDSGGLSTSHFRVRQATSVSQRTTISLTVGTKNGTTHRQVLRSASQRLTRNAVVISIEQPCAVTNTPLTQTHTQTPANTSTTPTD